MFIFFSHWILKIISSNRKQDSTFEYKKTEHQKNCITYTAYLEAEDLAIRDNSSRGQCTTNCVPTWPKKKTSNLNTSLSWAMDLLVPRINYNTPRNTEKCSHLRKRHMAQSHDHVLPSSPWSLLLIFFVEKLTRDCGSIYWGSSKGFSHLLCNSSLFHLLKLA